MCERIREAAPAVQLWADIKAEFEANATGREILTQAQWDEIEQVRFVLHHMPAIQSAFTGGHPEVTILFTSHGIRLKARMDYLKPRGRVAGILDLKSFGNVMDKAIEEVPADEIGRNNYFVQPYVYDLARRTAGARWKKLGREVVHVADGMEGPADEWLDAALMPDKAQFHFVFAQTGGVPDIIVREFAEGSSSVFSSALAGAARLADVSCITSDNPRSEAPAAIMTQIRAGMPADLPSLHEYEDRAAAIATAVAHAAGNDVILVAGKGHEDYQEIQGVRRPFSDMEQAQTAQSLRAAKEKT